MFKEKDLLIRDKNIDEYSVLHISAETAEELAKITSLAIIGEIDREAALADQFFSELDSGEDK